MVGWLIWSIINDTPWTGSNAQLTSLQQKIHTYVGFALDGQMAATYPQTHDLAWRIVVDDQAGPVDSRTSDVITRVAEKARQYGGDLISGSAALPLGARRSASVIVLA